MNQSAWLRAAAVALPAAAANITLKAECARCFSASDLASGCGGGAGANTVAQKALESARTRASPSKSWMRVREAARAAGSAYDRRTMYRVPRSRQNEGSGAAGWRGDGDRRRVAGCYAYAVEVRQGEARGAQRGQMRPLPNGGTPSMSQSR